jgi:hypothetical protein
MLHFVISMVGRSDGRFVKREDLQSLIEALSTASENMMDIDYSMVFSSTDGSSSATASSKLVRLLSTSAST